MDTHVEKIFDVIPVSPGIAIGKILHIGSNLNFELEEVNTKIDPDQVVNEIAKFHTTVQKTKESIEKVKKEVEESLDKEHAQIFDAHLMMLCDRQLINDIIKLIEIDLNSADVAVITATESYAKKIEAIPDPYLRERAADIRDIRKRFLSIFYYDEEISIMDRIQGQRIVIAHELTPSETVNLDKEKILGFAVESGSETCHTAILARSMRMPAVVNIPHELFALANNTEIIVDGFSGRVIVNPTARTREAYQLKADEANKLFSLLMQDKELVAETLDGFVVQLGVNLENADDVKALNEYGAEAVGLFRTEMLYLANDTIPTEEEQYEYYKNLLTNANNKMVVVRTLDIGGDKLSARIYRCNEQNPFLGLRGIRLCLTERRDLFKTQLRALIRAGVYGDLKIMIPMLSSVGEVIETKVLIAEVQEELKREGLEYSHKVCLGGMVETPACALMVEHFAKILDFLSIGSNDLVQYTMSIDRSNEKVSYLYQPASPAILELIYRTVNAAKKNNIWVSVCGQIAGDPLYTPLLLGLGINELSMEPSSINTIRRVVRSLKMSDAEDLTLTAMNCPRSAEVKQLTMNLLKKSSPEIAELLLMQDNAVI